MSLSSRNILVTGGAGFIGSPPHRAPPRGRCGRPAVDDCSNGDRDRVPDDAEFLEADLTDPDALSGHLGTVDLVFHLAASKHVDTDRPHGQFDDNTRMTRNILEAMADADVTEIAYTSSSTVYGEGSAADARGLRASRADQRLRSE